MYSSLDKIKSYENGGDMHFAPFWCAFAFIKVLVRLHKMDWEAAVTLANALAICFAHQLLVEKQLSLKVIIRRAHMIVSSD